MPNIRGGVEIDEDGAPVITSVKRISATGGAVPKP
jgi:hypothetical protein